MQVGVVGGRDEGSAVGGGLDDIVLIQLTENIRSVDADGQVMKEFIGVCPIGAVDAAMALVVVVCDLDGGTDEVIGDGEFVILGAIGEQTDAGPQ